MANKKPATTNILNLSNELIIHILSAAVEIRGLKRALRLRLVCKPFKNLFNQSLFTINLLDQFANAGGLHRCSCYFSEKRYPVFFHALWQEYMFLRVTSTKRRLTQRIMIIKSTAELYALKVGDAEGSVLRDCMWKLCDIRLHKNHESLFNDETSPPVSDPAADIERALLVAATRMNNVALATSIMEGWEAKYQSRTVRLFGPYNDFQCPSYVAARYCCNETLDLFLRTKNHFMIPNLKWSGCGLGGTRETLDVILKHWPQENSKRRLESFQYYSQYKPLPWIGLCASQDPAFLEELRLLWKGNGEYTPFDPVIASVDKNVLGELILSGQASWGNDEVVEHLIKLGVSTNASFVSGEERQPLRAASGKFRSTTVKLLLKYGADPNQCEALLQATRSGSLDVVRILLDAGANFENCAVALIQSAVRLEHERMIDLLISFGIMNDEARESGIVVALEEGLESMLLLLKRMRPC